MFGLLQKGLFRLAPERAQRLRDALLALPRIIEETLKLDDQIAELAQFFSFGTNDLTQMTYGISRDDAEGKFLLAYVDRKILPENPFQVLDRDGVGKLMKTAVQLGRATRPGMSIGICGEHGGDPSSIEFCHMIGLDYVSCSPYRVPIARLAAAQAAIREKQAQSK